MVENKKDVFRIAFITGTLGQGGAERQLFYAVRALHFAGYEVLLLSLTNGEFWQKQIEELGVPVIWVGQLRSPIFRLIKLLKSVLKFSPNIIQSQHFYVNLYVALVGRILNIPHLGAIRSNLTDEIRSNGIFGWWCLHFPRYLVVNSKAALQKALFLGIKPENIFLLPNTIDCDLFTPEPAIDSNCFRLLSIGSLARVKNFGVYIDVCDKLRNYLNIRAVLVGDGPERKSLEDKVCLLQLDSKIFHFAGRSDNVLQYYQNTDVFILSSLLEGTPNVVMEAMACGLPVVSTRVGGVDDLIENGITGYLIEPGDNECEQFVQILTFLAGNSELRKKLGENARKRMFEKNNNKFMSRDLKNIYSQVVGF